jgi:hypothetical protein
MRGQCLRWVKLRHGCTSVSRLLSPPIATEHHSGAKCEDDDGKVRSIREPLCEGGSRGHLARQSLQPLRDWFAILGKIKDADKEKWDEEKGCCFRSTESLNFQVRGQ